VTLHRQTTDPSDDIPATAADAVYLSVSFKVAFCHSLHNISVADIITAKLLWSCVQDYPGELVPEDKTNQEFTEAGDSEWQWHQLGHM